MKFLKYGLVVTLITVIALSMVGCSKEPLAAAVNGKKITVAEVEEKLGLQLQQFGGQNGDMFKGAEGKKRKNQLRQATLNRLIGIELILQETDRQGIKVTDKEVDKKIEEVMKRSNLKDQKELEKALKEKGVTLDEFKEEIDKAIRVEKLISKGIKVTEKDIEKHYNENKALFKKDQVRVAQVVVQKEEEAKRILNEIKGGTDFAKLAKQYSIDPYKDNGGEMPWMDKGGLYPTLAEACWKLNPGQISDVIKTDWSYHIIKLIDKRPADKITLAMVKNEVKADLLAKIKQDTYLKLIDKLRKKADIKEYLPKEETTSAPGVSPSGQQPAQPSEKSVK